MNYNIELFDGPDYHFFGTIPLLNVVQESFEKLLKWNLKGAILNINVLNVPENNVSTGFLIVENKIQYFGYTYNTILMGGKIVYRHPHPMQDVVSQTLQNILKEKHPEIHSWKFRVDIPGIPHQPTMRQTPPVKGAVSIKPFEKGKGPGYKIKRIEEKPPPKKSMTDYGITPKENDKYAKVKVLIPQALKNDLCLNRPLSHEVEEGGFLVGRVFQDADGEGCYLIELSIAPNAEYTGASFFHFTFTGDSFVGIKKNCSNVPMKRF